MLNLRLLVLKLGEEDKRKHFWVCFFLQFLFLPGLSAGLSIILILLIGTLKECWDQRYGSGFCWYDMLANTLGMTVGLIAFMALQTLWLTFSVGQSL